jgi:ankyrin repeat protein
MLPIELLTIIIKYYLTTLCCSSELINIYAEVLKLLPNMKEHVSQTTIEIIMKELLKEDILLDHTFRYLCDYTKERSEDDLNFLHLCFRFIIDHESFSNLIVIHENVKNKYHNIFRDTDYYSLKKTNNKFERDLFYWCQFVTQRRFSSCDEIIVGAATYGSIQSLQMMLYHGASINTTDYLGRTPLIQAIMSNHKINRKPAHGERLNVIKFLLDQPGININYVSMSVGKYPQTCALSEAVNNGDIEVVNLLIQKGVDLNIKMCCTRMLTYQ